MSKRRAGAAGRDHLCRPFVEEAGLPHRDEVLLERERRVWPAEVVQLTTRGKGGDSGKAPDLTVGQIEDGFAGGDNVIMPAAAFLAGRSRTDDPEDIDRFRQWTGELIDRLDPNRLRAGAEAYVEAAMTIALLGDADKGVALLQPLVADRGRVSVRGYLAAFYLAQLGDPSGWPAMVEDLHSDSEHTRLMATRHLLAFRPFDGEKVGDEVIDLRGQYSERLMDSETYVTNEAAGLMEEAGITAV